MPTLAEVEDITVEKDAFCNGEVSTVRNARPDIAISDDVFTIEEIDVTPAEQLMAMRC